MSASAGLLNFLTNVQTLESTIASTIFEMALKLSSLTSASVFLVVESEQSRRVAGSPELVEKYRNNSFLPCIADSIVTLNPSVSSLDESPLMLASDRDNRPPDVASQFHAHNFEDFQRPTNGAASSFPSGTKRKSNSDLDAPRPKKTATLDDPADIKDVAVFKMEPSDIDGRLRTAVDVSVVDIPDSDSDDVEILVEDYWGNSPMPTTMPAAATTSVVALPPSRSVAFGLSSSVGGGDPECASLIAQMKLNSLKIETLQNIGDPTLPFQKGALECRLISSLFYDFGKELRRLCPFDLDFQNPSHRSYFARHVDAFLERFPNLELQNPNSAVSRLKVEVGSDKKYTPAAFLRVNARNGFKARRKGGGGQTTSRLRHPTGPIEKATTFSFGTHIQP